MVSRTRSAAGLAVAPKGKTGDHPVASAMMAIRISAGGALLAAFTGYALRQSHPLVGVRLLASRTPASGCASRGWSGESDRVSRLARGLRAGAGGSTSRWPDYVGPSGDVDAASDND